MARTSQPSNPVSANSENAPMSENRQEQPNGQSKEFTYTLKAVHPDYDIVIRVLDPASIVGCSVDSLLKMAERTYKHIQSNEAAASNGNAKDKDDYPGEEAFLATWRNRKRQEIIDGKIGFKQVGPRMSPVDKEWFKLIDQKALAPKLDAAGISPFPTSGKAMIQGKTLNDWRMLYKQSPKWAHLGEEAKANVEKAKAEAEAAKAAAQASGVDLANSLAADL